MTFTNSILAGTTLVREAIQSENYVTALSGWIIRQDGSAEFANIVLRGISGPTIIVGPDGMPQIIIGSTPTTGYIQLPTNDADESTAAFIDSAVQSPGPGQSLSFELVGPQSAAVPGRVAMQLNSARIDGSNTPFWELFDVISQLTIIRAQHSLIQLLRPSRVAPVTASASSCLLVLGPAGQTGKLLRLQDNGADRVQITPAGLVAVTPPAATDTVWSLFINGDAASRYLLDASGRMSWGPGNLPQDTTLYRAAAGRLQTDGSFTVGGQLAAANLQAGLRAVTTVAGTWVSAAVTFPTAFASPPVVQLTGQDQAPAVGTATQLEMTVNAVTTSGFSLRVRRDTAVTMNVGWLATDL